MLADNIGHFWPFCRNSNEICGLGLWPTGSIGRSMLARASAPGRAARSRRSETPTIRIGCNFNGPFGGRLIGLPPQKYALKRIIVIYASCPILSDNRL